MKQHSSILVLVIALFGCVRERNSTLRGLTVLPTSPVAEAKAPARSGVKTIKSGWMPRQMYQVTNGFTIILYDPAEFAIVSSNRFGTPMGGFCEQKLRILHLPYVPYAYDVRSNALPHLD